MRSEIVGVKSTCALNADSAQQQQQQEQQQQQQEQQQQQQIWCPQNAQHTSRTIAQQGGIAALEDMHTGTTI